MCWATQLERVIADSGGTAILMMNNARPPLNDMRVRRALAHAWDQRQYISVVFKDIVDSTRFLNQKMLDCTDYGYLGPDLEKARQLIAE